MVWMLAERALLRLFGRIVQAQLMALMLACVALWITPGD